MSQFLTEDDKLKALKVLETMTEGKDVGRRNNVLDNKIKNKATEVSEEDDKEKEEVEEEKSEDEEDMEECGEGSMDIMSAIDNIEKDKKTRKDYDDEEEDDDGEDEEENEDEEDEEEGETEVTIKIEKEDDDFAYDEEDEELTEASFGDILQKATKTIVGTTAAGAKGLAKGAIEGILGQTLEDRKAEKQFQSATKAMMDLFSEFDVSEQAMKKLIAKIYAKQLIKKEQEA